MNAVPVNSRATYLRALSIIASATSGVKADPLTALLGLKLNASAIPGIESGSYMGSGDLSTCLYTIYSKEQGFDGGLGPSSYLDLFKGQKRRAGNDWRNAFGSQKGLGCFASNAELFDSDFRAKSRPACAHRTVSTVTGDFVCQLSPNSDSTCRSTAQSAGEVTKALKVSPSPAGGVPYRYQLGPVERRDLSKLVSSDFKLPVLPMMVAIYSGARSDVIRKPRATVSVSEFLSDLRMSRHDAEAIFDFDERAISNRSMSCMTEPFLLAALKSRFAGQGFFISLPELINFHLSLKTRAFVILSGISGTGKSLLPRVYAEAVRGQHADESDNLEVIPVRPGWNDLADLMGYYNSIHQGYEPGPAVRAISNARSAIDEHGEMACFLVLDEMNLARVEHYFADFLSVTESRRFDGEHWTTEPLRLASGHKGLVNFVGQVSTTPFIDCVEAELTLPDNLFVIGTINIDETTHGISSKVLDRANTIEFEHVNLLYELPHETNSEYVGADFHLLGHALCDRPYRTFESARSSGPEFIDGVVEKLHSLYELLEPFRLHFGLRTRDEVVSYMAYARDLVELASAGGIALDGFDLDYAFDRQILQKVLPRVSGTREELQSGARGNLFEKLASTLSVYGCAMSAKKVARMSEQEIVNFWEA